MAERDIKEGTIVIYKPVGKKFSLGLVCGKSQDSLGFPAIILDDGKNVRVVPAEDLTVLVETNETYLNLEDALTANHSAVFGKLLKLCEESLNRIKN